MNSFNKELTEITNRFNSTNTLCAKEIAHLNNFIGDSTVIFGCICDNSVMKKEKSSLGYLRFLQSILYLNELPSLLMAAHYTSGVQILRYHLECSVQGFYLDQQHPTFSLENKLCILEEVADNREYFVTRLLDRMSTSQRDSIRKLYKELSLGSHPSHLDVPTIDSLLELINNPKAIVDCSEIEYVVNLANRTYDAIFLLVFEHIPQAKSAAENSNSVKEIIKKYKLLLLQKLLHISSNV